jgi:hypothetical protein
MITRTLAATLALTVTTSTAIALDLTITSQPTTGLPGYTTYTLTLTGDGELNAIQVDIRNFTINQADVFGPGIPSVFANDPLLLFFPQLADTDSYFLFDRPNLLVSASESESSMNLVAAFITNITAPFPLLQLVIPDNTKILAGSTVPPDQANLLIRGGIGDDANTIIASLGVPTPASATLLALLTPPLLRRQR